MLKSSGIAGPQMKDMSMRLTELAADISSFQNISGDDAFKQVFAGMSGDADSLKSLGVTLSAANLEAFAFSKGIQKSYEKMSQSEQMLLRYNYLLSMTKNVQGDFARNSGSWANQTQILSEQWRAFQTTLGQGFINVLTPVFAMLDGLMNKLQIGAQYFKAFTDFMMGTTGQVTGSTAKTATSVSSVGVAAQDMGKSLQKAGKAVKGNLAPFDQLNLLSRSTAENMGSTVQSMLPSFDMSKISTERIDIGIDESAFAGIKAALDTILRPLQLISFGPLEKSLKDLQAAILPFGETIFSGLKWGYENILVPLAAFVIEAGAPAFLNALSGAFNLLNPLIVAFQPLGLWLWESLLQPLAAWTGGLIVTTLNEIGTALTTIGTWISNNVEIIEGFTIVIAGFFAAWRTMELLALIQMSGGIVGSLNLITDAIKAGTIAKIADKAETAILTAMYAKDFVVSLAASAAQVVINTGQWFANTAALVANKIALVASTAAQLAVTAATMAWNAICVIATGVTTAFGVAMSILTSPITLVIAAIVAVVAAVVLLIKHWDTVKEVASTAWAGIQTAWTVAATWFNDNVISPITGFFSGLFGAMGDIGESAWTGIMSAWSGVSDWFSNNVTGPIGNFFKGMINTVIDGLNFMIRQLNRINVDIPDWVPKYGGNSIGFSIPEVPRLAQGGLVYGPTLAMVGDNRGAASDPEVIAPLSKLEGMLGVDNSEMVGVMRQILEAIKRLDKATVLMLNETELGRTVIAAVGKVNRQAGYTVMEV